MKSQYIYHVYGDYGYVSECELEVFNSVQRAKQFVDGYTKHSDTGGYNMIEVISFAADGEAIVHYRIDAESLESDYVWEEDHEGA